MAKRISTDELQKHINTLSMSEVLTILDTYSKTNGEDVAAARNRLITDDLQARLEANNINASCPDCHSTNISKYGSKEDLQYIADQQYVIEAQKKKKAKKSAP